MKALLGLAFLLFPVLSAAEVVVPIESVESFVNIRMSPQAGTEIVGQLSRDDELVYVRTVDGWHEVELPGGGTGYVHGDWANIVDEAVVVEDILEDALEEQIPAPEDAPVATEAPDPVEEAIDEPVEEPAEEPEVVKVPEPEPEASPEAEVVVEEAPQAVIEATPVIRSEPSMTKMKGRKDFVVRFRDEVTGTNSQIFDNGNFVGIGTTEPQQRLEVNGSIQIHDQNSGVAGVMITQSSGETGYILHNRASTLTIGAGSLDRLTIDRDGNIGFGVARPAHPLQMANGAHVTAGGVWANSSSRQRKQDIEDLDIEAAIQALVALEPVSFRYKNDEHETYLGFIAEDVPDIVATSDRQSLSTMDIVAVLTKVVQEQQQRITELEAKLQMRD
ncbi:MAG: tail fiber domain-containing protein [Gammaproteobacteria bacterium]|nr:tail fiber domain-containing protein [Gammaproteobacteria bacterium]